MAWGIGVLWSVNGVCGRSNNELLPCRKLPVSTLNYYCRPKWGDVPVSVSSAGRRIWSWHGCRLDKSLVDQSSCSQGPTLPSSPPHCPTGMQPPPNFERPTVDREWLVAKRKLFSFFIQLYSIVSIWKSLTWPQNLSAIHWWHSNSKLLHMYSLFLELSLFCRGSAW